jgi:hypothetical protein
MIETSSINEDRETGMKSVRIFLRKEASRPQKTELPEGREEADLPEDHDETESFEGHEETKPPENEF